MSKASEEQIRKAVKDRYGDIAQGRQFWLLWIR